MLYILYHKVNSSILKSLEKNIFGEKIKSVCAVHIKAANAHCLHNSALTALSFLWLFLAQSCFYLEIKFHV